MRTLARQLALLTVAVACVSTALTSLLLVSLAREATLDAARAVLGRDAEVLATVVRLTPSAPGAEGLQRSYERRGVVVAVVDPGDPAAGVRRPFEVGDVAVAATGREVSRVSRAPGGPWLVEGRDAGGRVVLLAQTRSAATSLVPPPRRRIGVSVVLAASVAALGGVVIAQALSRPLVRLDAAARRLSDGERGIRVEPEGPVEIADVARALNTLSEALATSEDRQRRFLLTVSHELRTPLTAVTGYAEALADGVMAQDRAREAGRIVLDEARRLQRRVDELLALARLEADDVTVEARPVDLVGVVTATHDAWAARAAASGVVLALDLPGVPVVATADGERLRQVLDALVDNALRVLAAQGGARRIVLAARAEPPSAAVVEVRDDGPGLEPEELAVAFQPGLLNERYRGRRPVGSGVGLALVARLASLMGGAAAASPAPEGGLAVTVRLQARHGGPGPLRVP